MLQHPMAKLTCQQICNEIIKDENLTGNNAKYLSGSVSSILKKMINKGELQYFNLKTARGGSIYQIKQ